MGPPYRYLNRSNSHVVFQAILVILCYWQLGFYQNFKSSQNQVRHLIPLKSLFRSASKSCAKKTCRSMDQHQVRMRKTILTETGTYSAPEVHTSTPKKKKKIKEHTHTHSRESCVIHYQTISSSFGAKTRSRPKYPWPRKTSLHK